MAVEIVEKIKAAGVVGCGGAGFPTHKKLAGSIEYLIVNGAECEPLLRTDRYLMLFQAPRLVKAVAALGRELGIPHCVFAVKRHYHDEIAALRKAIRDAGADIAIHELDSFYPAGDEQTIVFEVTGRVVPPAGLPIDVGAVVDNVATVFAVADAMEGIPFTRKYLTVTGEVRRPAIVHVPVGTSFRACLELAGGVPRGRYVLVAGGPMMGQVHPMEQLDRLVVTKTTSGILVLPEEYAAASGAAVDLGRMVQRAQSVCIQCSSCTQLCPRHLLGHPLEPHRIMRKLSMGGPIQSLLEDPDIRNAQLCCECGICERYACPMGLYPRRINHMLKEQLAAAGLRYQAAEGSWQAASCREERKAPSKRVAARAGVGKYDGYEIRELREWTPDRVEIPVKMHIGAPAEMVVAPGDRVEEGDIIARPPEGTLGAVVHASISGCVEAVGQRIVLVKK